MDERDLISAESASIREAAKHLFDLGIDFSRSSVGLSGHPDRNFRDWGFTQTAATLVAESCHEHSINVGDHRRPASQPVSPVNVSPTPSGDHVKKMSAHTATHF